MMPGPNEYFTHSFLTRSLAATMLAILCFVVIMGFSVYVELKPKPAQAFFFSITFDPAVWARQLVQTLVSKALDFAKSLAISFIKKFINNLIVKMIQKLESINVIKNMMYYSDALGFDKYIGSELNKMLGLNEPTVGEVVKNVMEGAPNVPGPTLPSPSPPPGTPAPPSENPVADVGSMIGKSMGLGDFTPRQVELLAQIPPAPLTAPTPSNPAPSSPSGGLNQEQVSTLLRGALASLTSAGACGGISSNVVTNMAVFNATRARGINPAVINPKTGNFYTDMAKTRNPFASPSFQQLFMQDTAMQTEAKAQQAISQELSSAGQKAIRSEKNNISRSGQAVADTISQGMNKLFGVDDAQSGSFASMLGSMLADTVTSLIFKQGGAVLMERTICGIGQMAGGSILTSDLGSIGKPAGAAQLLINGGTVASVEVGGKATLTWNIDTGGKSGNITISNYPDICGGPGTKLNTSGTCTFIAKTNQTFGLHFIDQDNDTEMAQASLVVLGAAISFSADPNPSPVPGTTVTLSWQVSDSAAKVDIYAASNGTNFTVTNFQGAEGSTTVTPQDTTTYTLVSTSGGKETGRKDLCVEVTGGTMCQ